MQAMSDTNYCDFISQIKVGLAYSSNGELKQRRGSSLPIDVKSNISDITLKRVALDKHLAFNKQLPRDHEFVLLYPDFQQVKCIPGTRYYSPMLQRMSRKTLPENNSVSL